MVKSIFEQIADWRQGEIFAAFCIIEIDKPYQFPYNQVI